MEEDTAKGFSLGSASSFFTNTPVQDLGDSAKKLSLSKKSVALPKKQQNTLTLQKKPVLLPKKQQKPLIHARKSAVEEAEETEVAIKKKPYTFRIPDINFKENTNLRDRFLVLKNVKSTDVFEFKNLTSLISLFSSTVHIEDQELKPIKIYDPVLHLTRGDLAHLIQSSSAGHTKQTSFLDDGCVFSPVSVEYKGAIFRDSSLKEPFTMQHLYSHMLFYGANPKIMSIPWFKLNVNLTHWTLSSIFSRSGLALTAEAMLNRLFWAYKKCFFSERRPILSSILEGDITPGINMILLVVSLNPLKLSDGFYTVLAELDNVLSSKLPYLNEGQKLLISNATLKNPQDKAQPLDSKNVLMLSANSTFLSSTDSKLGLSKIIPYRDSVADIFAGAGSIPHIRLTISRIGPTMVKINDRHIQYVFYESYLEKEKENLNEKFLEVVENAMKDVIKEYTNEIDELLNDGKYYSDQIKEAQSRGEPCSSYVEQIAKLKKDMASFRSKISAIKSGDYSAEYHRVEKLKNDMVKETAKPIISKSIQVTTGQFTTSINFYHAFEKIDELREGDVIDTFFLKTRKTKYLSFVFDKSSYFSIVTRNLPKFNLSMPSCTRSHSIDLVLKILEYRKDSYIAMDIEKNRISINFEEDTPEIQAIMKKFKINYLVIIRDVKMISYDTVVIKNSTQVRIARERKATNNDFWTSLDVQEAIGMLSK